MPSVRRLLTRRDDLGATVLDEVAGADPAEGEAVLAIDRFALTTNNITYAAYGDSIGYWSVFPTGREGLGQMPVWGFADVVASRAPGVPEGARVYGFLPMADRLTVRPAKATERGFTDAAEHRAAVPAVYSWHVRCDADPHYAQDLEGCQAVFRPLFITSYTAVEFLREKGFFGARQVLISSASSKTAYGLAWAAAEDGLLLVGLTSGRNRSFVEGLGAYDRVLGYDELDQLPADVPTLYVDLAADPDLRRRVHERFGTSLTYDCLIGSTQSRDFSSADGLVGPKPTFFFAAEVLDRHREAGTLRAFLQRFEADQLAFYRRATAPERPWITLIEEHGYDAAARVVRSLVDDGGDPAVGQLIRL